MAPSVEICQDSKHMTMYDAFLAYFVCYLCGVFFLLLLRHILSGSQSVLC